MTIERLTIDGFRRWDSSIELELRPLNVLLGANGSGKTSFLDTVRLIARSAAGALEATINEMGGLSSVLTRGRATALHVGLRTPAQTGTGGRIFAPLEYSLSIDRRGQAYHIAEETLTQQLDPNAPRPFMHVDAHGTRVRYIDPVERKLVEPNWDYNASETALSQVPKMHSQCEAFRQRLASLAVYSARDLSLGPRSAARAPQPMRPARLPGPQGENLVPCLYYLRETDADRFEMIEDALRAAFPTFEALQFPPVAAGTLAVTWKDRDFDSPFFAHELSDGTLRFLWLVSLLSSPDLTAITLIDEPEVSLHPQMLSVLCDLLREASMRTQIIVATHSESLVRFLHPGELLVIDVENGRAAARWGETFDLDSWLDEYTLDQLWRMNRFGANP